ncbi:MAG: hypothetical protein PHI96_02145 [Desulfovibrio sp.]|nr:hypothetical protein [Desulfovibrio sp.]
MHLLSMPNWILACEEKYTHIRIHDSPTDSDTAYAILPTKGLNCEASNKKRPEHTLLLHAWKTLIAFHVSMVRSHFVTIPFLLGASNVIANEAH